MEMILDKQIEEIIQSHMVLVYAPITQAIQGLIESEETSIVTIKRLELRNRHLEQKVVTLKQNCNPDATKKLEDQNARLFDKLHQARKEIEERKSELQLIQKQVIDLMAEREETISLNDDNHNLLTQLCGLREKFDILARRLKGIRRIVGTKEDTPDV